MSRRRHRRGPRPPQKVVKFKKRTKRKVNTEVHEAFWSGGKSDKIRKLSDREFNGQVADEVKYMFRKSAWHAKNAIGAFSDLLDLLF